MALTKKLTDNDDDDEEQHRERGCLRGYSKAEKC
jgi:hypothetical protein